MTSTLSVKIRSALVILAAVCTVATVGVCMWDGLNSGCQAQSNIRFHDGFYDVNALAHGGILEVAGVQVGDEIVAINGASCSSIFSMAEALRETPPGSKLSLRVRRGDQTVELSARTWRHLDPGRALTLLVPIAVLMTLGLGVFFARPATPGAGLFLLYCLSVSINTASHATHVVGTDPTHRWLTFSYTMLSLYDAPLMLHLFLVFPHRGRLQRALSRLIPIPYAICLLLGLNYLLPTIWPCLSDLPWMPPLSRALFHAYGINSIICLAAGALSLLVVALAPGEYRIRQQARLLFAGFIALGVVQVSLIEIPILIQGSPLLDQIALTLTGLILPLTVAAAIVLHQMFGINVLVRHGLVYGATSVGIGVVFAMIVGGAGWVVQRFWPSLDIVIVAIASATAAFLFQPIRSWVQDLVDRTIYRRRYDYRQATTEISSRLASILDARVAIEFLRNRVTNLLEPDWLDIVVRTSSGASFERVSGEGEREEYCSGEAAQELARRLVLRSRVMVPEEDGHEKNLRPALLVPIVRAQQALGLMRLGPREGGVPYLPEDWDFLETLASLTATTLERGRLLEERSLRERLALVGSATSALIHELKNPLAAIKSTVAVLRRRLGSDERGQELTHIVDQEIDHLHESVINVLSFVQPRRHDPVTLDFDALLRQAIKVIRPEFLKAGVEVVFAEKRNEMILEGDPERLRQLCLNLLLNSREAQPGGGSIECTLESWRDERGNTRGIELKVLDQGSGFTSEVRLHAFEPFFTTKRLGTGLGLVNVKRIVDDHSGEIELENRDSGGAAVTIRLPRDGDDHARQGTHSAGGR